MPSFRFFEYVSPLPLRPHCVGCPPKGELKWIAGSEIEFATPGKLTPRKEFSSLLISPIQPNPTVITSLLEMAFEYVKKRPVPSRGSLSKPESKLLTWMPPLQHETR